MSATHLARRLPPPPTWHFRAQVQELTAEEDLNAALHDLQGLPAHRVWLGTDYDASSTLSLGFETLQPRVAWAAVSEVLRNRPVLWQSSTCVMSEFGGTWGRYHLLSEFGHQTGEIESVWLDCPPTPPSAWIRD